MQAPSDTLNVVAIGVGGRGGMMGGFNGLSGSGGHWSTTMIIIYRY